MKIPVAIVIGSIIVAASVIFNGWYERGLAYNTCVRMMTENPFNQAKYNDPTFIKKYCEFLKPKNNPEFYDFLNSTFYKPCNMIILVYCRG